MITVIYEKNLKSGYGHYNRCSSLCSYFYGNGIKTEMIELDEFISNNMTNKGEIVLVDISFNRTVTIEEKLKCFTTTIGLDWFHKSTLDYNIVAFPHHKPNALKQCFIGLDYLIVDQTIQSIRPVKKSKLGQKVLIVIGGGDINNQGVKAAYYCFNSGYEVHLVLGPLAKPITNKMPFTVSHHVSNMPALIANSDWMVTNGGSCLFEAVTSGRPAIALPQNKAEGAIVSLFKQKNAIIGDQLTDIHAEFNPLEVILNGKELLDGKGAERILNIVKGIVSKS